MAFESEHFDIIIVGAGPIGLACAIEAKKAGFSYVIIEKGCLVNSLYNYPLNMTFFSSSDRLEIGNVPFISHYSKPNRTEALEYYRRVCTTWNLNLKLYEEVKVVCHDGEKHDITTSKGNYTSKYVILSLGFYDRPYLLNVPGEDLPNVRHYYGEPHPYFGQKVVIVGAANSAVDAALETWRKGAEVTMVIRESSIRDNVKYWVRPDIENRIKEGAIKAYFNSTVKGITEHTIEIKTPEGDVVIDNDFVLAMTGYQPPFEFMKVCGIKFKTDDFSTPEFNEQTMESNVPGLYLAGVVIGGLQTSKWFIENSRVHAELIVNHLKTKVGK